MVCAEAAVQNNANANARAERVRPACAMFRFPDAVVLPLVAGRRFWWWAFAGAGQARDQRVLVWWKPVAAPANVLVGPDQCEARVVSGAQTLVGRRKYGQRHLVLGRSRTQLVRIAWIAVRHQQREAVAKMIVERGPVGEPKMRRETAGIRRRHVEHEMIGRRLASIRHDNRRIVVTHAENDAESPEFTNLG